MPSPVKAHVSYSGLMGTRSRHEHPATDVKHSTFFLQGDACGIAYAIC